MRVLSRQRQEGKTTEAVEWVKGDPDRVLLVINETERKRVIRQFNLAPRKVVGAQGALQRLQGRRNLQIGVDNIDLLDWRTLLDLGWLIQYIELATETR